MGRWPDDDASMAEVKVNTLPTLKVQRVEAERSLKNSANNEHSLSIYKAKLFIYGWFTNNDVYAGLIFDILL